MKRKITALIMLVVMAVSMLSGCGSAAKEEKKAESTVNESSANATKGEEAKKVDPITIKFWN